MLKRFAGLLQLVAIILSPLAMCFAAQAQDRSPIINLGDAVVSGFSGTLAPSTARPLAPNKSPLDVTFINPDGPSARIVETNQPGFVWDGRLWNARKKFDVLARDAGQVFGVAIDDQQFPNIYLTATSAYGLRIVVPDRDGDGLPERVRRGERGATWMVGQFGLERGGGPGSIWKVDGRTGQVSLFANVMFNSVANSGAALGNITYDTARKQLFVSDLHTGMIHRFDLSGRDLGQFDHGTVGRRAARLPEIPFNPASRIDITNNRFDSENPDTWGLAQPERRVWGLAIYRDRLYYSVWAGPQIWSVGIRPDGSLGDDPRWELDVEGGPGALPVTDIVFSNRGAMILAQRGGFASSYDYSALTRSLGARVLRYWLEQPDDPRTPSAWIGKPEEYAVGFTSDYRAANGGVDLGYGYDARGRIDLNSCEGSLWTTGENLRNDPGLRDRLDPGGALVVHGIQGSPAGPVRDFNAPPWTSYFIDYDDKFEDPRAAGHLGLVRVFRTPCTGPVAAYGGPGYPASAPYTTGGGCVGPTCACFIIPTSLPTNLSLPPFALPLCTQPGQPVSLVLDTRSALGVDLNWTVSPWGGPNPFHTGIGAWTALPGNWVQPTQSVIADPLGAAGPHTYTRRFNLSCPPSSYQSLQLTGRFAADNSGVVRLNGNILPPGCAGPLCFNSPLLGTPFTAGSALFVQGPNLLTVTVGNIGSPIFSYTGLSVIAKLEAVCGPDCICGCPPGTVLVNGQCVPTNPIDLTIGKENSPAGGSGTWFNLWVTNLGAPITFPVGGLTVTDAIPAGMTVTSVTAPNWTCGPPPPPNLVGPATLTCTYNLAGSLATGAQLPGSIVVNYTTTGPGPFTNCATIGASPVVGVDTNPANDTSCVTVTPTCPPPSVPGPIPGSCTCIEVPGALCGCPPPLVPSPVAGLCVLPPPSIIDLGIEKTGGTSPVPEVNGYAFHLTVTNVGAAFSGSGVITVKDTVPAGMRFDTAGGPNWTCVILPANAGSTITCTYTGAGPTAGQVLGTIDIFATALGSAPFPPFTQCATVGLTPASGLQDIEPMNDNACVTVTKPRGAPRVCDPRTTTKRGDECMCRYPGMERSSETACMCIMGNIFVAGRGCVKPIVCRPPLVPNAARTACVCSPGFVQRRGECVRPVECRPPSFRNPAGTACLCPTGFVMQGRECVRVIPRQRIDPRGFPGIPGFPSGPGRDGPRGGPRGG